MGHIASQFFFVNIGSCVYGTQRADLSFSQLLNEIMPMIYRRFTEKTAEEWRQIYKVWSMRIVDNDGGALVLTVLPGFTTS